MVYFQPFCRMCKIKAQCCSVFNITHLHDVRSKSFGYCFRRIVAMTRHSTSWGVLLPRKTPSTYPRSSVCHHYKDNWLRQLKKKFSNLVKVFRIRIHPDPSVFRPSRIPDPLVRGMDPDPALDPDSSIIKYSKKNFDFYCFVTFFDFLSLKMMYKYLEK
jgi:hypothetical protein